jgi:hypothetical protein
MNGRRWHDHAHRPVSLLQDVVQFVAFLILAAAVLAILTLDYVGPHR